MIEEKLEKIQQEEFSDINKKLEHLEEENANLSKRERILKSRIAYLESTKAKVSRVFEIIKSTRVNRH